MEISNGFMIVGGPVKKEFKAPFVASAMVYNNIRPFAELCKAIFAFWTYTKKTFWLKK